MLCLKTKPWARNQEHWPGVLVLPGNYCVTQGGALTFLITLSLRYGVEVNTACPASLLEVL